MYMFVCLFVFLVRFFLQGGQQCWALWAFLAACPCTLFIDVISLLIGRIKMLACLLDGVRQINNVTLLLIAERKRHHFRLLWADRAVGNSLLRQSQSRHMTRSRDHCSSQAPINSWHHATVCDVLIDSWTSYKLRVRVCANRPASDKVGVAIYRIYEWL